LSAKINPERVYAVSAAQDPSTKLDLNEKSGVPATKNFEFGIAVSLYGCWRFDDLIALIGGSFGLQWADSCLQWLSEYLSGYEVDVEQEARRNLEAENSSECTN
jgi:hypothetical protein